MFSFAALEYQTPMLLAKNGFDFSNQLPLERDWENEMPSKAFPFRVDVKQRRLYTEFVAVFYDTIAALVLAVDAAITLRPNQPPRREDVTAALRAGIDFAGASHRYVRSGSPTWSESTMAWEIVNVQIVLEGGKTRSTSKKVTELCYCSIVALQCQGVHRQAGSP